jgi:3-oxoacyl-(acyl-carrier-protein) synthase
MTRAAVLGWGLVAPGASNIKEFQTMLSAGGSYLEPFHGFGPDTFLVGKPKFDFAKYEEWLSTRFPPARFKQLKDKMDKTTLYAIAGFIQALGQNPGLEEALKEAGEQAHVYVSNALGAFPTIYSSSITLYKAQRRWNRFWCALEHNSALASHQNGESLLPDAPIEPSGIADPDERESAEDEFFGFWAQHSSGLKQYLLELSEIEAPGIDGDIATGKMKLMRDKRRKLTALKNKWQCPEAPWAQVSSNVLWNIPNTPAAQISMMGHIKGPAVAPVAACSSFSVALKMGLEAIERGDAKFAVIGAADPPPHPLTVGAFYSARVLSADGAASKPLSKLKGTHVAGGSCIWIIGDVEYAEQLGFKKLGLEPLAVGTSSDADHIITPSEEGPRAAMRQALEGAAVKSEDVRSWDLHATATPGDFQELENLKSVIRTDAKVTARKGTFGHGMGVGGGWELTAQYLSVAAGTLYPTPLAKEELHPEIAALGQHLVLDSEEKVESGPVGKLSMGVGGINACVISRPFDDE